MWISSLCGNGVVWQCAAAAFGELWRVMEAGHEQET